MVCHSLLQWTTFCQTSSPWPAHLGWPHRAWLSFIEFTRLWSTWLDWLVSCDYGFSVSALWCPLATPTILLGFLLPWTWGISSQLLQQSAAAASYLGWGISPHCCSSLTWTWSSSSRPSCACTATAPWTWCGSSRPPPLASEAAWLQYHHIELRASTWILEKRSIYITDTLRFKIMYFLCPNFKTVFCILNECLH